MAELRKRGQRSESIPWATLQDGSLSYTARGILGYVLSKPAGWDFSAERIARDCDAQGKDAVLKALRELETAGYRCVTTERGEGGRIHTVAEFAYEPSPEWIEAAKRRAAKKSLQKTPGPKGMGSAAKAAALESLKGSNTHETAFPQVGPESGIPESGALESGQPAEADVSPGGTGIGDTGIRSAGLLRSPKPEVQPQQGSVEAEIPEQREAETVVVVESANPNTVAAEAVLSRSNPIGWARMTATEQSDLTAKAASAIERGWTVDALMRKLDRRTDENTRLPYRILTKALADLGVPPVAERAADSSQVAASQAHAAASAALAAARDDARFEARAAKLVEPHTPDFHRLEAWIKAAQLADLEAFTAAPTLAVLADLPQASPNRSRFAAAAAALSGSISANA
jgi:hypothetical protein